MLPKYQVLGFLVTRLISKSVYTLTITINNFVNLNKLDCILSVSKDKNGSSSTFGLELTTKSCLECVILKKGQEQFQTLAPLHNNCSFCPLLACQKHPLPSLIVKFHTMFIINHKNVEVNQTWPWSYFHITRNQVHWLLEEMP